MKKLSVLTLSVSLAFSVAACVSAAQAAPKAKSTETKAAAQQIIPVDRIAAVVNHDVITEIELQQRVHQAAMSLRQQKITLPPMNNLRNQVLDRMILERIIEQKAQASGIRIDDNMMNGAIEQIAQNNGLTVPQLEKKLAQDGVSFRTFKSGIRSELITQRLREREVDDKIQIPESEVDQFIKDQLGPEKRIQYRLARIVIGLPANPTQKDVDEATRQANIALTQASKGADFGQLAARYSRAPEAMEGGVMGWIPAGRLPSFVLDAVKKHKTGDIIPVRTPNSVQIYKILGVRDPGDTASQTVTQTHLRQILMRPTNVTPENVVVTRLNQLKDRLDKGDGDFASLARLHSADPSGTRGGDLGWLYPGDLPPEIEQMLSKLSPGEVSAPVKTPYGWHIFQVLERRNQSGVNERLKQQARDILREQKLDDAMLDWERKLMSEAYIEKRVNKPAE